MQFKRLSICIAVIGFGLVGYVLFPPRIPNNAVVISVADSNSSVYPLSIEVSNTTKHCVDYNLSSTVHIAFLGTNGWTTNDIGYFISTHVTLYPTSVQNFTNLSPIPSDASKVRVGVTFVSLSWRSWLAYKLPSGEVADKIASFLFSIDRSSEQWSDIIELNSTRQP
jgi:hypothetical protein